MNEKTMKVTAGNVLIECLPFTPATTGGMEATVQKVHPYEKGKIVQVGKPDPYFAMDEQIKVGAQVIVPQSSKLTIDGNDGKKYVIVHYRDLRVILD